MTPRPSIGPKPQTSPKGNDLATQPDTLAPLRVLAEFLDTLSDMARATSQAIHEAIPDLVEPPPADDVRADSAPCLYCRALDYPCPEHFPLGRF